MSVHSPTGWTHQRSDTRSLKRFEESTVHTWDTWFLLHCMSEHVQLTVCLPALCPPALHGLSVVPVWNMHIHIRPDKVKVSDVCWMNAWLLDSILIIGGQCRKAQSPITLICSCWNAFLFTSMCVQSVSTCNLSFGRWCLSPITALRRN